MLEDIPISDRVSNKKMGGVDFTAKISSLDEALKEPSISSDSEHQYDDGPVPVQLEVTPSSNS